MPKFSRETAPEVVEFGIGTDRTAHFDDWTYNFTSFTADADGAPLLEGLEGNVCQCPHYGYLFAGQLTFTYADGTVDKIEAGEAFYAPPGHTPYLTSGSEFLMISPSAELKVTEDHMLARMQELGLGGPQ